MYNIFIRSRSWLCLASCAVTLLALLVTITDSQSVSDTSLAWPYHYYAPAFSHADSPVVLSPYRYLGTNRDHRILNIFKKGAGPQLVIRQKQSGHSGGSSEGHGWGHRRPEKKKGSSGGILSGWLPKKSFGVHVTGGLGFSFGGKKKEEEKKEEHGWGWPQKHGWGSYHNQHNNGWGSYHHKPNHGWGNYHSKHGQHSYGYSGYDDEYTYDDNERSAISELDEEDAEFDQLDAEIEAEGRADLRPRILLIDNLYEDEEEEAPFFYAPHIVDEYY